MGADELGKKFAEKHRCEYCHDTGWYGNNGPGMRGNSEYHPCDMCKAPQQPERCACTTSRDQWKADCAELAEEIGAIINRLERDDVTMTVEGAIFIQQVGDKAKAVLERVKK
jgi:hypothetical protein